MDEVSLLKEEIAILREECRASAAAVAAFLLMYHPITDFSAEDIASIEAPFYEGDNNGT